MRAPLLRSILDKITDAVVNDKIDKLKFLIYSLPGDILKKKIDEFLYYSVINGSENCSFFLLEKGATIVLNNNPLHSCKYFMIHEVYYLCEKISFEYNIPFDNSKDRLIKRILEPYKVEQNPERVTYLYSLFRSGFFSMKEIKECIDKNYVSEIKKGKLKVLLREITLSELGI